MIGKDDYSLSEKYDIINLSNSLLKTNAPIISLSFVINICFFFKVYPYF